MDWGGADLVRPEFYNRVRTTERTGREAARALVKPMKRRFSNAFGVL
jgi:hypothetical protein